MATNLTNNTKTRNDANKDLINEFKKGPFNKKKINYRHNNIGSPRNEYSSNPKNKTSLFLDDKRLKARSPKNHSIF